MAKINGTARIESAAVAERVGAILIDRAVEQIQCARCAVKDACAVVGIIRPDRAVHDRHRAANRSQAATTHAGQIVDESRPTYVARPLVPDTATAVASRVVRERAVSQIERAAVRIANAAAVLIGIVLCER